MLEISRIAELRRQLAAAFRLAVRFNLHEGVCNHFSIRVPGEEELYLINPMGLHWSEITASRLLLVDGAGVVLEGQGVVEPTAFFIHTEGHKARPDALCILHTHMPYATALTCVEGGRLRFVHQNALRYFGRIAYDDGYNGLAMDASEGVRIAEGASGGEDIVFLAHHGVVVHGRSVAEAFTDLYYLERSAQVQVLAMSTGLPLREISPNVAAQTAKQFADVAEFEANYHFAALERVLAAEDPAYRD
ncbi:aldolase [Zavarzinia compransoris]|uniref:Aldolase n=1 Tax=Zavarzinia compransoris TaxID=1264899 RepID=A0A317E3G2_9PROT|nr:aldolase [Zavarzinia compransoris]PWR20914.1 aldolase [Zavarzinia compransoris]TDP44248.1 ribulose-5-phosphate 4-epimerase/fuculose-1-phosphate aldolase [Zavarzinia compransoris]